MSAWADRIAQRWTAWYTRGLAAELAERRVAEIRSDLFDHATASGRSAAQQRNVLGRVLWGIPADLSWRRAARASSPRRRETGAPMRLQRSTTAVIIGLVLFELWAAVGSLTGDGGGARYATVLLVATALLCIGLAQRATSPRRSTVLIIAGAAAPVAVFYWMAPIFVPLFLAVSALVVASHQRRRSSSAAI
jgi:hypothetical protein